MDLERIGFLPRRRWMQLTAGLAASSLSPSRADDPVEAASELILRGEQPLNAETPVDALSTWITPNRRFFIRSHFGAPAVGLHPWTVTIEGAGDAPLDFALKALDDLEQVTIPAVLQCSGNGRGQFRPIVPGVGWVRGAVGNAEWTGVRLADFLKAQGIPPSARHVHFQGQDVPPHPKTPAFLRSLPLDRVMDPSTLLATKMNGEPIPAYHGGPLRLVVPGWSGNHWIKWLRWIRLAAEEAPGFYQQTGYRIPKPSLPPGAIPKPEDLVPVTTLNVKSLITAPATGSTLKAGDVEIRGVAWTGYGRRVDRVEVATDGGPWKPAELYGPDQPFAWRLWRLRETMPAGRRVVRARAFDSEGDVQPETTPWNKSGYLWNGIESVTFEVGNS